MPDICDIIAFVEELKGWKIHREQGVQHGRADHAVKSATVCWKASAEVMNLAGRQGDDLIIRMVRQDQHKPSGGGVALGMSTGDPADPERRGLYGCAQAPEVSVRRQRCSMAIEMANGLKASVVNQRHWHHGMLGVDHTMVEYQTNTL